MKRGLGSGPPAVVASGRLLSRLLDILICCLRLNDMKKARCAVLGCFNSSKIYEMENISYFRLPTDRGRAREWLKAIKRKPTAKLVVCELHFESELITVNQSRKRLAWSAVPTLQLPGAALVQQPPRSERAGPVLVCHQATQASPDRSDPHEEEEASIVDIFVKEEPVVSSAADEPSTNAALEDWTIKEETPEAMTPETYLDTFIRLSDAFLSPQLAKFVQIQARLRNKINNASEENQCENDVLMAALKLYYSFPQSYKLMQESLNLPSMSQLKRLYRPLTWEINSQWTQLLRARFADAPAAARDCVLCVATVPLRAALHYDAPRDRLAGLAESGAAQRAHIARRAVVVYARGIHARWRQPLACCLVAARFVRAELRQWLDVVIAELFAAGLTVRALVTDFDHALVPTARPVTPDRPYFTVKKNWQVYCLYDITRLLMRFRDLFMEHDVNFGGMIATWDDIEELYEYNITRAYKLAPSLTRAHVRPTDAERARPQLAAETLSRTVAAALAAAVELRVLDDSAHGSVQLVAAMGALYEHLHSKELSCGGRSGEAADDANTLNEMMARLERLFLLDPHSRGAAAEPGVLAAMRGDLRAVLTLLERARRDGHAALPMRAFNNDPIHEFFDRLRALNRGVEPTAKQLLDAFRRTFVFNILKPFKPPSKDSDLNEFLKATQSLSPAPLAAPVAREWRVPRAQYATLLGGARASRSPPQLARQLLWRCAERDGCAAARGYCTGERLPEPFLALLARLEARFREHASSARLGAGALGPLLASLDPGGFDAPCPCFPVSYVESLYMHFRLHNLMQFNNNRFRQNKNCDYQVNVLS